MVNRLLAHPAKLIFLAVLALVVVANHEFLFVTPWHEDGDFAVNALQIERAKHLDEIYGNYSRFHFNHPGPAFFYVYAAGEYLFHDWLQIVPAPHNAHALAGLLLQAAAFAAALGIAAGWFRSGWFLPLALLLGGVHFSLAGNAFASIWPPYVLLMPFLCFLVAAASTAAGRAQHLPLTVLAGCFLVHGHISQVLFVVVIFLAAYGLFYRGQRGPGESLLGPFNHHRSAHLLTAACLGLFVLPLLIDLAAGADSNLVAIFRFMAAGQDEDHKSLAQSLSYLLSFFAYFHDQDSFLPEHGPGDPGFIFTRAAWYLGWLAVLALTGFALRRLRSRDPAGPERRFAFALAMLTALGFAATIVWGLAQTGPMFEFNGHFYHALLFAVLLLLAAGVAPLLPERGVRPLGAVLCAGGALVFGPSIRVPESANSAGYNWVADTAAVLEADPLPAAAKFLVFDENDWGDVAKTALALKRMGGSYRVDGHWSFMFGRYRTFQPVPPDFDHQGMSVWRFSRHALPGRSVALAKNLKVFFDPAPLNPDHFVIDCGRGGNLEPFVLYGFTPPDGPFAWTDLPRAALQFRSEPVTRDVQLTISAAPFAPRHIASQSMELHVNGRKIAAFEIDRLQTVQARIPAEAWNRQSPVTLVFSLPRADSPLRLGISRDPRILGWSVYQMTFDLAEP